MAPEPKETKKLVGLPVSVARPVDLGRLIQELEKLDDHLLQAHLRHDDETGLPRLSRFLEQTAELNKVNLLDSHERQLLLQFLAAVKTKSPVLHMSFSADPSPAFIEKLIAWLRSEIHPLILVTVGLQPTLGAGCIVRSTNKYFDLSLRQDFAKKRELLRAAIAEKAAEPAFADTGPKPISVEGPVEMPVTGVPASIPQAIETAQVSQGAPA